MHVPVWPTLPQSNLSAGQLAQKFNVASLGGLGCDCTDGAEVDSNTGECVDGSTCGPIMVDGSTPNMGPTLLPGLPDGTTDSVSLQNYIASINGTGAIPPGQQVTIPTTSGKTITVVNQGTAAAPNYVPVIGAAVQGALSIAKLLTIQPGTTLQASGAISRQTAGVPLNTTAINSTLATPGISGTTMLLIAAAALFAFMSQGGKK